MRLSAVFADLQLFHTGLLPEPEYEASVNEFMLRNIYDNIWTNVAHPLRKSACATQRAL